MGLDTGAGMHLVCNEEFAVYHECPHHLLSVGKISAENVCGLTMEKGPYGACFLDFGDGKRCTLHNQGILILPFASKFGLAAAKRASFRHVSHYESRALPQCKPVINQGGDGPPAGMQLTARRSASTRRSASARLALTRSLQRAAWAPFRWPR